MRVADTIVDDRFLLDAFLRDCEIEMDDAIAWRDASVAGDFFVGDEDGTDAVPQAAW